MPPWAAALPASAPAAGATPAAVHFLPFTPRRHAGWFPSAPSSAQGWNDHHCLGRIHNLPEKLETWKVKSLSASGPPGTVVPSSSLAAEREEAKAVVVLFLRKQGLSSTSAARVLKKSDSFINHLVSELQAVQRSHYLLGSELSTPEIRSVLIPYLDALLEEHGGAFTDIIENFPDPPGVEKGGLSYARALASSNSKRERAVARVIQKSSDGDVLYLLDLGLNLEEIKEIAWKFPAFAYYNLDRKVKPVVELLLSLGVPVSDIPRIIQKRPQLCGISFSENLKPMMSYMETVGVDKAQWGKVICRFPALLTYSRQKVKITLDFLAELGVSPEGIGKILTRCPHIIGYSVNEKLRPTAEYFTSIGVDVAALVQKCPQTFGLSIETNLQPVTEFLLERGFSIEEISTMVYRYGPIYTFSLSDSLEPKWDFFLSMEYPRSELVKFPQYFGYSLEERIKLRYRRMRECGVRMILNQLLSTSHAKFEDMLAKKMHRTSH